MPTDEELLDWIEDHHTLHGGIDILYVVDGYEVQLTHDGTGYGPVHRGVTLRDALANAFIHNTNKGG